MSDVTVLHHTRPRSRKEYRCENCGRCIVKGEIYDRQDNVFDGQRYSWISCMHCTVAWSGLMKIDQYVDELDDLGEGLRDDFGEDSRAYSLFRSGWLTGGDLISVDHLRELFGLAPISETEETPDE